MRVNTTRHIATKTTPNRNTANSFGTNTTNSSTVTSPIQFCDEQTQVWNEMAPNALSAVLGALKFGTVHLSVARLKIDPGVTGSVGLTKSFSWSSGNVESQSMLAQ